MGSLTAKAVIIQEDEIVASKIIRVKATSLKSAEAVMGEALSAAGMKIHDIDCCCSTGYGRFDIPFSNMNKSEISCHGLGAFWTDNTIRTIIDIGGQDCKAVSIDENGMVNDFVMNEKCAAGTGRSLEILAKTIGIALEDLGPTSLKSKKNIEISNKCSIFMELDVIQHLYQKAKLSDLAHAINMAVAKRVSSLAKGVEIKNQVCITGGVAKNIGVVTALEKRLNITFKPLSDDPQLMGAIGAAVFAMRAHEKVARPAMRHLRVIEGNV